MIAPPSTRSGLAPDLRKIRLINEAGRFDQALMEETRWPVRLAMAIKRNFLRYYFFPPPMWRVLLRACLRRERMAPAFASLGAARSGTSLLADYIMQHPCVVLPLAKEVGFGHIPLQRFIEAQFPSLEQQKRIERQHGIAITGYCAPVIPYLGFGHLAAQFLPRAKFVIIMRDPVDRTFAHWRWDQVILSAARRDPLWQRYPGFDEAMRMELESIRHNGGGMPTFSGPMSGGYIQTSIYLPFLLNLFRIFDRKSALFINANEFFAHPVAVAQRVYAFLELPEYEPVEMPVKNAGPPGEMQSSTRALLRDFFKPHNEQLYEFIGEDLRWQ